MKTFYIITIFLLFASFSNSQTPWYKYENPVFNPGPENWDIGAVGFCNVIFDGTIYKLWYTGCIAADTDCQVGYAESNDGINWTKSDSNPILTPGPPGSFDAGILGGSTGGVIYDEGLYKMWYMATDNTIFDNWRIGYATSSDGISWTKQNGGNPVIDIGSSGEWDDLKVGNPTVIRDGSLLKMWYHAGRTTGSEGAIGYATSTDGIIWTKYNDPTTTDPPYAESDPVLEGTTGTWDAFVVRQPNVILTNSGYEMWYVAQGTGIAGQNIGHATSPDGINWTKDTLNPLLIGQSGQFDRFLLAPNVVLMSDATYRMWYTGSSGTGTWRVGFATTDSSGLVDVNDEETFPNEFSLSQNYPNPFNPSTTISWQSPVGSWQTLKVYDLLGKEVATLFDEYRSAGSYEVEFDASQLSSGTYFYRLQAGEYVETKKLILMK